MEKEQIVKALEICSNYQKFGDCDKCPAREGCDNENNFLEKEALSLIREQEKRIFALEADNEHLGIALAGKLERIASLEKMVIDLTKRGAEIEAENVELRDSSADYREIAYLLRDAKAEIVRKMHAEIKRRLLKGGIYPAFARVLLIMSPVKCWGESNEIR